VSAVDDENPLGSAIVKAYVIEDDVQPSNAAATTEDDIRVFTNYGAILPPYDPRQLHAMFERSCSLRPNIDVYKTNIESFGHRLEPVIDLESEKAQELVQDAMLTEKIFDGDPMPDAPTEEVEAEMLTLPARMRAERLRLEQFFETCTTDISFVELRERVRQDLEITGNGYIEVLRNGQGDVAGLNYIPAVSMRLLRAAIKHTTVQFPQKISAFAYRDFETKRRLRLYVQVLYGQFIAYFKELDDPRIISSRTGNVFKSLEHLQAIEPGVPPATEILHMKIHSPLSAYGVPRWIGATLAVLGSRSSEEVNATYFDNKAVPPMAILVSGGQLAAGAAATIKNYIRDNIRGKDNFHKIMVLEAESAPGAIAGANGSRCRIEVKNLQDSQHQDALFQQYDANNTEKVGNQFRLPKILRGDMKDFNRATADAALQYAEQQVFQPERNKFDHIINKRIFPLLGIRFFKFVSNGVAVKDPVALGTIIKDHVEAGILTPNEGRSLEGDVLGKAFPKLDAPWADKPIALSTAELAHPPEGAPPAEGGDVAAGAKKLIELRAALHEYGQKTSEAALANARKEAAEEVHHVPQEIWRKWFQSEPEPKAAPDEGEDA
jgi:PBSX family phage portal protein